MNNLKAKVGKVVHTCTSAYDKVRFSRNRCEFEPALTFRDAVSQFPSRNRLYAPTCTTISLITCLRHFEHIANIFPREAAASARKRFIPCGTCY